ncbi:MAG TPA: HlyD family efflux transporter periplasmic adaptor subunit [Chitinophaga sp.]|uniref:HlyD family secretion protein n=1 Tax=Chitinophaga sp. TaxID=1869181 RepID=UPI002B9438EE|nr:HlyD family efflux transporter periplasmic adaptor subunit [Chitinophaga sp.]HVI45571.1 HlyD family efflux transporter periplasmic adaptor subunit [Chitinophaga sp.]
MPALTEDHNIELRSPAAQRVLGRAPSWLISWGNTIILGCVVLLLVLSCIIKYPDVVNVKANITSKVPPVSFVCKMSGPVQLLIQDGQRVSQHELLAYIASGANISDVRYLYDSIRVWEERVSRLDTAFLFHNNFRKDINAGTIQINYNNWLTSLENYRNFIHSNMDAALLGSLNSRKEYLRNLSAHLVNRRSISMEDVAMTAKKMRIDSGLYAERVIASVEFDNSKTRLNQSRADLEYSNTNIISNQIQIREIETQCEQLRIKRAENEKTYVMEIQNNLRKLHSELESFINEYAFIAPFPGVVSFPKPLVNNQFAAVQENIFNLVPYNDHLVCTVALPMTGSGKVKPGQRVNIKLDNFPYHEFGYVKGTVESLSLTTYNNSYTAVVSLPRGLTTSYGRQLTYKPGMSGNAEIITNDLRLIERLFNQLKALNK